MKKQTVAVDLDGVLAKYMSWQGVENIGDPIPGAKGFMEELMQHYFVIVFTTRCSAAFNPDYTRTKLVAVVEQWLIRNDIPYNSVYSGQGKPLATAYVDDRGVSCEPQKSKLAYEAALHQVDRLARVTAAASDGDYIEELAKMNVAPDGTRLVPGLQKPFPCRSCEYAEGDEHDVDMTCTYNGDCVEVE